MTTRRRFFHNVGSQLKRLFGGWHAWILGYRDEDFASIGLKPSVKFPINNGGLECTLREYVLFDGNYADFKTDGGSVHNDTFVRRQKPARRESDEEWESNARRISGSKRDRKPEKPRGDRFDKKSRFGKKSRFEGDDRDDKRGFSRDRNRYRKPFKPYQGSNSRYKPSDRGPRIDASHTAFTSPGSMRSRKVWKKRPDEENNDD